MHDLNELLEGVNDRDSFLEFVKALIEDRKAELEDEKSNPGSPIGPGSRGWENGTIENYLDASVAWVEAWNGKEGEVPKEPTWQSFARILYAGKYYE